MDKGVVGVLAISEHLTPHTQLLPRSTLPTRDRVDLDILATAGFVDCQIELLSGTSIQTMDKEGFGI